MESHLGHTINVFKCKSMSIAKNKVSINIENVHEFNNLGITISDNLNWDQHILKICKKANRCNNYNCIGILGSFFKQYLL